MFASLKKDIRITVLWAKWMWRGYKLVTFFAAVWMGALVIVGIEEEIEWFWILLGVTIVLPAILWSINAIKWYRYFAQPKPDGEKAKSPKQPEIKPHEKKAKISKQPEIKPLKKEAFVHKKKSFAHNVSVLEAVYYMAYGKWEIPSLEELTSEEGKLDLLAGAKEAFEQLAHDGDIPVWGRIGFGSILSRIPEDHWKSWQLDGLLLLLGKPEKLITKGRSALDFGAAREAPIGGLKTNKKAIEKRWPPENK